MDVSTTNAKKALISVIIPIYNAEKTLDRCLSSVEQQTHRSLEIVCVNDGSSDRSAEIMREHAARDSRIVLVDKPNEGYGASCNRGIDIARGAWVAIVEPDDTVERTGYETLLACAENYGGAESVDVVKGAYWRIFLDGRGSETSRMSCPYHGRVRPRRQPFAVGDATELLRHHPAIWSALYRRSYLVDEGIRFVEALGSGWVDNPFLVETLCRTRHIAYTDECVYDYVERDLREAESFAARSPLIPLERWNEMMDAAALANVDDRRVISALALRGVNYALITVEGAGLDAPGVRDLLTSSMERLDADLVLSDHSISPAGKRLFAQVRGIPEPRGGKVAHAAHLAKEALYRVRTNGLSFALETAKRRRRRIG